MSDIFIGIDVGGTNIKSGCFDSGIKLLSKASTPTNAEMGPKAVIDTIAETIGGLLDENNLSLNDVCAIGIGTPGPADYKNGTIIAAPNMPKFNNVPIRQMLSEKTGKLVVFDNDANVACWGEHAVGAGKGTDNMVFFTLGTGVGGGIIINGQLVQGSAGNGAELGHTILFPEGRQCGCGQKGCVETYTSATSTVKRVIEAIEAGAESSLKNVLAENGQITCKDVYDHLSKGDKLAEQVTEETAKALGLICVNMVHITESELIVFAGGMIAAGDILLDRIKYYFDKYMWSLKTETVRICFATLGEDAGIYGAAALAEHAFKN